ncbi:sigma-70 family RNA polymerase sigma factor [candidate division KSB1 bacterium]|nr:sigma-70 family RNA polymerase sigma factor [candidate division KSB1 bacterium]
MNNEKIHHDLYAVQQYLNGNHRVERILYDQLRSLVLKIIRYMQAKGCIFKDQENVISEIVCHIMVENDKKILRAYQGKSQLTTYLWPIVRFRIIDEIRREKSYQAKISAQQEKNPVLTTRDPDCSDVETIIEEHIENEPPLEKFIKYARWMQELSYEEIAVKAKLLFKNEKYVNFNRVNNVLHTNRKNLLKKLKNFGF